MKRGRKSLGKTVRREVRLSPDEDATLQRYAELHQVEGTHGPRPLLIAEALRRLVAVHAAASVRRLGGGS